MNRFILVLAALTLAAGSGLAQAEGNGHEKDTGGGHEKCIGDGHRRDEACRGTIGNLEGEIGDRTYCDKQFAQAVESSWRRYACDLSTESTAYGDVVLVYGETTAAGILDYSDGALGLIPPPPAPSPQVIPTDYIADLTDYAETTSTGLLDYSDGALGLIPPPPAPSPQVIPDPTFILQGEGSP